ncbi:MAG TPA: hypothetical protein VM888_06745 [Chitinophagaceae bacterium]|nr:hypothetical protein [Chitinophagaceae bacterium]
MEKEIINTWMCYKISNGEREDIKKEDNTSEMTFHEDGRLVYRFTKDNISSGDNLDRHWKINIKNDVPFLLINEEPTYQIISLQDGILILESIKGDGFRHHYATIATYEFKKESLL